MKARIVDRGALLQLLTEYFSEEDLKTLCFELDVDYDALEGGSKTGKARELVEYCENRDRLADLAAALRKARPTVQVPITLEATVAETVAPSPVAPSAPAEISQGIPMARIALILAGVAVAAIGLFTVVSLSGNPEPDEPAPPPLARPTAELTAAVSPPASAPLEESFESWTNPLPANMFIVDRDAGNDGHLSVTDDPAHVASGSRALQFTYIISNTNPDPAKNYAGFEHVLPSPQDWSAYGQLCASVEADADTPALTFQFGSGYPEADYTIVELQPGRHNYCVPVRRSPNSANLNAITSYWFYIDGTSGQGEATIYIDDVRLVP